MANSYVKSGRYNIALDLLNHSVKINDSLKNYKNLAFNYLKINSLYGRQKRYKEALKYGLGADSFFTMIGDSSNKYGNNVDLGIVYKNLGEYDKAIALYRAAIRYFSTDTFTQMYIYSNWG